MPTYDYECDTCGVFEASQRISEPAYTQCPKCGSSEIRRLLSAPAFHLKGSGWYKTDYASTGSSSAPTPSPTSTTGSETKSPDTPKETVAPKESTSEVASPTKKDQRNTPSNLWVALLNTIVTGVTLCDYVNLYLFRQQ